MKAALKNISELNCCRKDSGDLDRIIGRASLFDITHSAVDEIDKAVSTQHDMVALELQRRVTAAPLAARIATAMDLAVLVAAIIRNVIELESKKRGPRPPS